MSDSQKQTFDSNYLLVGLSQEVKDEIYGMAKIMEMMGHRHVIEEDEKEVDLIVVLSGTIAIYKGEEKLAEAGPGSVLGEVALVDNLPRSAHAISVTPVTIAKLDGNALRKYMFQNKDVGFIMLANLCRVLSARLRSVTQQVEDLKGASRDPWEHSQ